MDANQVKKYLSELTNKQLTELLVSVLKEKRCDEDFEFDDIQAHWCIAEVSRIKNDDSLNWESWEIGLLALHDPEEYKEGWDNESPICQSGDCGECGTKLMSWAKKITCPVCNAKAYAT